MEYEKIKQDIKNLITKPELSFNCGFDDETWKSYRDKGKLMCQGDSGSIFVYKEKETVSILYDDVAGFWIPTRMIITDEHEKIQKIFIELATKYKKKHKDLKVIFYHHDLPKEGKIIFQ